MILQPLGGGGFVISGLTDEKEIEMGVDMRLHADTCNTKFIKYEFHLSI